MVGKLLESNPDRKETEKSDNASQLEIDFSESSSDSFEEEIPTSKTRSPVPKPPRHLIPSPAHIPTLETASPSHITKAAHPQDQYGALSIPSSDPDWYDNNLHELQPDAQQMAEGKDEQSDKISQSGMLPL